MRRTRSPRDDDAGSGVPCSLRGGVGIDTASAGSLKLAGALTAYSPACPRRCWCADSGVVLTCEQEDPRIDHTVLKCTRDDHVITIASAGAMHFLNVYMSARAFSHVIY